MCPMVGAQGYTQCGAFVLATLLGTKHIGRCFSFWSRPPRPLPASLFYMYPPSQESGCLVKKRLAPSHTLTRHVLSLSCPCPVLSSPLLSSPIISARCIRQLDEALREYDAARVLRCATLQGDSEFVAKQSRRQGHALQHDWRAWGEGGRESRSRPANKGMGDANFVYNWEPERLHHFPWQH